MDRIATNQARMARANSLAYMEQLRHYYIKCMSDLQRSRNPINEDTYERNRERLSGILRDIASAQAAINKIPRI